LGEAIKDACEIMAPQKLFKNIRLECHIEKDAPPVKANGDRMTQVLVNLLLNAAEAMVGEGAVTVRLGTEDGGKTSELIVEDDGPGIPGEILDVVFEPFVTTKPEGLGTGLGLSVCHGIVRSFGGTLLAENVEKGGAKFTICIPAVEA